MWDHYVRTGKGGVAGVSPAEVEKKTNEKMIASLGVFLENQFILV